MALETVDFFIRPEDGWVPVSFAPAYAFVKPSHSFPYRVAVGTDFPPPPEQGWPRAGGQPFEFLPAAAGSHVWVRVDRAFDHPLHFGVIRSVETVEGVVDLLEASQEGTIAAHWSADDGITEDVGVASWVDRINSYDLVQATDANQPAFSADGFSGRACVVGDGVNDILSVNAASLPQAANPCEIWALFATDTLVGVHTIFSYGGGSLNRREVLHSGNTAIFTIPDTGGKNVSVPGLTIGNHFVRAQYDGLAGRASLDSDVLGAPVSSALNTASIAATAVALAGPARFLSGSIRHVIVTIGTLTAIQATVLASAMQNER